LTWEDADTTFPLPPFQNLPPPHRSICENEPSVCAKPTTDILIIDAGGGDCSAITDKAWHVLSNTNHSTIMSGYQSNHDQVLSVVNAVTKATIEGREEPVLFVIHCAALVADGQETESLHVPFQSMRHGVKFDLTPKAHGGTSKMTIEDEHFPLRFDGEKLFFNIEKPTTQDLDKYDCYELTSEAETSKIWENRTRRKQKKTAHEGIPLA